MGRAQIKVTKSFQVMRKTTISGRHSRMFPEAVPMKIYRWSGSDHMSCNSYGSKANDLFFHELYENRDCWEWCNQDDIDSYFAQLRGCKIPKLKKEEKESLSQTEQDQLMIKKTPEFKNKKKSITFAVKIDPRICETIK